MNASKLSFHVASSNDTIYVRAIGICSMKNAPVLDAFLARSRDDGARTICIDLSEVTGMDSTFMGLMVGHSHDYTEIGGRLVVVRPSDKSLALLQLLGLTEILPVLVCSECPAATFIPLTDDPGFSQAQRADLIRRAHQSLAGLNEANRTKFEPFLKALEQNLAKRPLG